jgi:hypothetical protein
MTSTTILVILEVAMRRNSTKKYTSARRNAGNGTYAKFSDARQFRTVVNANDIG